MRTVSIPAISFVGAPGTGRQPIATAIQGDGNGATIVCVRLDAIGRRRHNPRLSGV
jgi:hypothetical protein